jgi:hypothetical protein
VTNIEQKRDPVTDIDSPVTPLGILLHRMGAAIGDFVRQEPDPKPESIIGVLIITLMDVIRGIDCSACRINLARHVYDQLIRETARPPSANAMCAVHAPPEARRHE